MPSENFSETTEALVFDAEDVDDTKQIDSNPLFLPDEEMDEEEDEGNVHDMLKSGNRDMDLHYNELQPNPLPSNTESENGGRPMRVRLEYSKFLLINGIRRVCQPELVLQDKLIEIYLDFGLIQT